MSNVAFDLLSISHTLAAAWRFEDAFSGRAVDVPLNVQVDVIAPPYSRMPSLPWKAVGGDDATYRFLVSNRTIAPIGTFEVSVDVPGATYAAFEPLAMTLPRPLLTPPYPTRTDFLMVAKLWPTRLFKIPPGETAVTGTIGSAGALTSVAGLRVTMWSAVHASPPPGTPYTYTDANGDFVTRLLGPDFRTSVSGGVVTTTANVSIEIRPPPTFSTVVTPTTAFPQTIQLGQVNTMPIAVP